MSEPLTAAAAATSSATSSATGAAPLADPRVAQPVTSGRRSVVILGSTGSIGTQAVDVIRRSPGRFRVLGLAAGGGRLDLLAEQALSLDVEYVAVSDADALPALRDLLAVRADGRALPKLLGGPDAVTELAALECDVVLNGITGSIGLAPTLAALESGTVLALANKESLVAGGPLVKPLARPGQIVPVDSEHSALYQCLTGGRDTEVRRLVLTASGGPFRGRNRADLENVTPRQALAHPTWDMGPMVSVNSATLMNKGLEIIEAHLLFDIPFDRIDVVVHPQSVVHSMVEFTDGSTLAQVSPPDMRIPIALGLGWPDRVPDAAPGCDWTAATAWTFFPLDHDAFPAVGLAHYAGRAGGVAPAVFNAANEECVGAFLAGRLPFTGIVGTVQRVVDEQLDGAPSAAELTLSDVLDAEKRARVRARELSG
ncbi:1-deoxy-D-xylulose-5-phosphate reductoisomerase [Streptomyces sp. ISL-43]|uniref:1-deoxy-D-xylulose-5-phosphate reductoisomerase n=1 Tax=Streptomyces sp. ISL-43 TaxID=2819183 RepID=UPI001BE69179|nr:1-deoxy-D-xylulose-5-phosphate reductoisomerase [Streptomyces sp. ISL-43]MBT2446390.1 1-deoxy-D-xylulose-5-phosphate reductoisomerase [Streptomyces sp. ISL-43]